MTNASDETSWRRRSMVLVCYPSFGIYLPKWITYVSKIKRSWYTSSWMPNKVCFFTDISARYHLQTRIKKDNCKAPSLTRCLLREKWDNEDNGTHHAKSYPTNSSLTDSVLWQKCRKLLLQRNVYSFISWWLQQFLNLLKINQSATHHRTKH